MIQQFCPEDYDECYTEGCPKCSKTLSIINNKEKIIEEAIEGLIIIKKICLHYNIVFDTFCKTADDKYCKDKEKLDKKIKNIKEDTDGEIGLD